MTKIASLPVLAISVLVLGACTRKTAPVTPSPAQQSGSVKAEKSQASWVCPMHSQIRRTEPGTCPICGMNLVHTPEPTPIAPVSEESGEITAAPSQHAPMQIPLERQQTIGVKTGIVEKRALFKEIRAPGRVAFDPELFTAQSEYLESLAQLARVKESPLADVRHSAQRMVESAKLRLKILGLSDKQIAALGKGERMDPSLLLHRPGEDLWIYAEVPELDLPLVTPGLEARITARFLGGKVLSAKVTSVDRILNPNTRTGKVRISVTKANSSLRPETYVDATILAPLGDQIAVPFDAIFDTGKEAWAFVAKPGGIFEPRSIEIKLRAGDWVAIESGLRAGDRIVTSANFLIDSESRLRSASLREGAPACPEGQVWHEAMGHCMTAPKNDGNGGDHP